jgi:hypothetical protein
MVSFIHYLCEVAAHDWSTLIVVLPFMVISYAIMLFYVHKVLKNVGFIKIEGGNWLPMFTFNFPRFYIKHVF